MADRSYYNILGVDQTVSQDEIQAAYRKLARTWHPDVNKDPQAEEEFKAISEAYDVLSDPELRAKYDRFGDDFRKVPDDYSEDFRGGRQGRSRPASGWTGPGADDVYVNFGGSQGVPLDDLFGGFWGDAGRAPGPRSGPDQQAEIELTIDEAFNGGERKITLPGRGDARTYTVTIPKGIVDGQKIRLAGEGGRGTGGGPPGDLFLVVRLRKDRRYRLDGRDIVVDVALTPSEAVLGATIAVPNPGGETKVKVPAGSSSGRRLRLAGRGMPARSGSPGDLYAVVKIHVPADPTERERELYEELATVSTFDPRGAK